MRKVTPSGYTTTVFGFYWGMADGYGTSAKMQAPYSVAVSPNENGVGAGFLYIVSFCASY